MFLGIYDEYTWWIHAIFIYIYMRIHRIILYMHIELSRITQLPRKSKLSWDHQADGFIGEAGSQLNLRKSLGSQLLRYTWHNFLEDPEVIFVYKMRPFLVVRWSYNPYEWPKIHG